MDFNQIYFIISFILSAIGILIIGILNYNNQGSFNDNDIINSIGGVILISFLWPLIIFLAILSIVFMTPLWVIYQIGKLIGKLIFKQEKENVVI